MMDKYKNLYADDDMYGHVVEIVKDLNLKNEGVHLDIACGYAAINSGLKSNGYNFDYVGIDANEDSVKDLKKLGLEVYQHEFTCNQEDFNYIEELLKGRKLKLITVLDFLEHLPQPESFLKNLSALCKKYNALLIISVPNICHKDIAFKMMEGEFNYTKTGLLDKSRLSFFSAKRLEQCMNDAGFQQVVCKDLHLEQSDQNFPPQSTFLSSATTVYQYFNYIKELVDPFATVNQFVRAYVYFEKGNEREQFEPLNKPFLSVITRTQGLRIEALSEALLCLTGQTNTNFEVLIIGHKLTIEHQLAVERVIEELPDWLREKVRLIRVDHGNRTTPLNVGFEQASGEYIAILDDDDIVFDNWVEEFYNLYKRSPGTILHTYALLQKWDVINYNGTSALRAAESPNNVYCTDFDLLDQLNINVCPTMTYACPSYAFQKLGIKFNEEITVTEDWDFLMRTSFITGVANSNEVTSIYRIWKNAENSCSEHSKKEWQFNEDCIKHQFTQIPIVLPKGYALKRSPSCSSEHVTTDNLQKSCLYFNCGSGFSEDNLIFSNYDEKKHLWNFKPFPSEKVSAIRFDPTEHGMIWVTDVNVDIYTANDDILRYNMDNIQLSNGLKIDNGFLFLKLDPQIIVPLKNPVKVKHVKVSGNIISKIPECIFDTLYSMYTEKVPVKRKNIFYRALRKVYCNVIKQKNRRI